MMVYLRVFWELHNSRLREFGYSQNSLNFSPKNIIALGYNFRNWFAWVPDSRLNDSLSYARITSHFFSGSWRCRFPGCLSESTSAWTDNPNPIFTPRTQLFNACLYNYYSPLSGNARAFRTSSKSRELGSLAKIKDVKSAVALYAAPLRRSAANWICAALFSTEGAYFGDNGARGGRPLQKLNFHKL